MRSYAQNAEDVRLARVFGVRSEGFYIDVGAAHPVWDSVTKHFYDLGWNGIDVEPDARFAAVLLAQRPRDRVVEAACSDHDGDLVLYETGDADGWSTASVEVAGYLASSRGRPTTARSVRCFRAVRLWEESGSPAVDFLKIDAEGHEREVLAGAELKRMRPSVLIIEATAPHRPDSAHAEWEYLVLASGYLPAGFDGLNRWYVSPERSDLGPDLERPMSFFDSVELNNHVVAREQLALAQAELAVAQAELTDVRMELSTERAVRAQAEAALAHRRGASLAAPRAMVSAVRRVSARLRQVKRALQ
jgi:FkbM family methyltransferase